VSEKDLDADRRRLLKTALPLATMACLGCRRLAAQSLAPGEGNRFLEKTGMTTEETYAFFYATFIPVLQSLSREMGPERFLAALTKAAGENVVQMITPMIKDLPARNIKALAGLYQSILSAPPQDNALTYEITEQSDKVLELRFTACLPAKLLRAMNAADIGYAIECSTGSAAVKAFNPEMVASNPKNLMKGDSFCIERVELQA
jgi:hypothetical protein